MSTKTKFFFCYAAFHLVGPQTAQVPVVILPLVQNFVELHKFIVGPFLQPAEVPLAASTCLSTTSPSYVSPINLLIVYSAPSSRSLIKMLNSTKPRIDSLLYNTKDCLQLDFAPLITWKKNVPVNSYTLISVGKSASLLLWKYLWKTPVFCGYCFRWEDWKKMKLMFSNIYYVGLDVVKINDNVKICEK